MKQFQLTLRNDKLKQYDRIALFIIIINLALFTYLSITSELKSIRIAAILGIALTIICLGIEYFLVSIKKNENSPYKIYAEYAIAFAWLQMGFWWIGIVVFFLGFLYQISKRPLLINVLDEKVTYPSFPQKNIPWANLNNIILKDGLLTIDLKNNKYIQQPVDETKTAVNEQEFNDFCREQLNS